ncbi:hypothetical protein KC325_g5 [Hortaea werneckii]|nr:hypothetical protein KC325_g5 [Hortaea werneckii]
MIDELRQDLRPETVSAILPKRASSPLGSRTAWRQAFGCQKYSEDLYTCNQAIASSGELGLQEIDEEIHGRLRRSVKSFDNVTMRRYLFLGVRRLPFIS